MRPKALLPLAAALTMATGAAVPAAASAADCNTTDWYSMYQSKPFKQFGDNANYWIMIGGGFENAWYYSQWRWGWGGRVVDGGEPFGLWKGDQSLALPNGVSATTPTVCINPKNPSFRFAMRATMPNSQLVTSVNFTGAYGWRVTVPARVNVVEQAGQWVIADSQPLATVIPAAVLQGGVRASITFDSTTPRGGEIDIDSVMVDPYRRG